MATAGKKGKKVRGKLLPLQHFLSDTPTGTTPPVPQGQKKVSSWADDDDEYERRTISLPTAPRASRMLSDESIPQSPPYLAYVSNLPYDVNESDIHEFFVNLRIESIRLPKEEGDSGRLRGFGYIEFQTRDDLIDAVRIADPFIRSRRIRIDISNENDQKRMAGGSNWRARGGNDNFKERDSDNRRGFSFRDRGRERDGEGSEESGNWRSGDRPRDQSPPPRQEQRRGFGDRENFKRRGYEERSKDDEVKERPKLNLIPRTLPIQNLPPPCEEKEPEPVVIIKSEPLPAANIFGSAKPVDTSAKEREIEDRLEKLEQERQAKKKEEKEMKEIKEVKELKETNDIPVEEKKAEFISWRKPADEKEENSKPIQTKERKYSPNRKDSTLRRRDERVGMRDNRDKDFRERDRDRDSKIKDSRDKNQKDYRNHNKEKDHERNPRESKDVNDVKNRNEVNSNRQEKVKDDSSRDPEDRMPKYQPPQGPNLFMSNKYAAFQDEDVSD